MIGYCRTFIAVFFRLSVLVVILFKKEANMKKKVLGLAVAALFVAAPAMAQEVPQVAPAPYNCDFMPSCEVAPGIYGKMGSPATSKFNLSIGGFVKLDYAYNSVNLGNSGALAPSSGAIPKTSSTAGKQNQSIFTARQSRFWLKVAGPTFLGAKTGALIEADFYGDPSAAAESPELRMRQAWGSIDWTNTSIMFGQAYDIFGPMIASTIDFRSGASFGTPNNPRVPQLRLTQKVNINPSNSLKLVLGVQDPNQLGNNNAVATTNFGSAVNVAGQAMWISKALGVAPGYYGLSMNSLTAGFFGLFGSEKVTDNANHAVDSWGYGFYTFVPILKSKDGKNRAMTMSFEGQAYMAANMAFNSATATTVVGSSENLGPAKGYGLGAQFIFYPIQDMGITAGYLRRGAYNYSDYNNTTLLTTGASPVPVTQNFQKYNTNIFANVAYDLNAAIRVAAEYENLDTQYGKNTVGQSGTGTANIARLAFFYFF
jgi:hypothetical protein